MVITSCTKEILSSTYNGISFPECSWGYGVEKIEINKNMGLNIRRDEMNSS